jgi:hypothetical protein
MARQRRLFGAILAIFAVIAGFPAVTARTHGQRVIHVSSITELYAAVNDPENAGARIFIAPGTYLLDPTQPNSDSSFSQGGAARCNGS